MKINPTYGAILLMEILYERGLINKETLQAARENTQGSVAKASAA